MVTGPLPLLVVALVVASIATAAPIFDLGWFFEDSQETEEISKEKHGIKNVVVVKVGGNSVSEYPSVFPSVRDRATTMSNNDVNFSPPTPSERISGPVGTPSTPTAPPNGNGMG